MSEEEIIEENIRRYIKEHSRTIKAYTQEYVDKLQTQLQQKENIIKEVREYINNHQLVFEMSSKKQIAYWFDMFYKELLDILDKVD